MEAINYNNPPQTNQELHPTAPCTSNITRNDTHNQQLEPQRPKMNPDQSRPTTVSQMPLHPSTTTTPVAPPVVRYRECLKNHAANMGANVLDGCGEFMPGGEDDTQEALKCAACECHRSFHRREVVESESLHRYRNPMPPIMMAFGGAPAESSSEDLNVFKTYAGVQFLAQTSKKRFRTKFTQEQKDKMHEFAERLGWKIKRQDEQEVLQFCSQVGLKKQVFKVWMHNNKLATKNNQL